MGLAHHRVGLQLKWYLGAYAFFLTRLIQPLCQEQDEPKTLAALVKAVFLDMSLAIEAYAKQHEEEVFRLARLDPLTGLPNRTQFLDFLHHELSRSRRQKTMLALIFLDLDDFKKVNDSLGHLAGDRLLREVALHLKSVMRDTDVLARFGGDEFVALLTDLDHPDSHLIVSAKLQQALAPPFQLNGHEVFVHASIGVALFPHHGSDPQVLFKHADAAMYEAKRKRLGVYCYNPGLEQAAVEKITLEGKLHQALERGEFYLVFQPQVSLQSGRPVACEALLRWHNPSLGEVAPYRFIPPLEQLGLIHTVGLWCLETACTEILTLAQRLGLKLKLALNLSALQLTRPDLAEKIFSTLKRLGFPPSQLELEITESVLLEENEITHANLENLRALGINFAIDDFGTGYCALSYLQRFPCHTLKIDKVFIQNLHTEQELKLARHIVDIGKALGLAVVAEGVETEAQLAIVKEIGCDLAQGYYFAHPLTADDLTAYLTVPPTG